MLYIYTVCYNTPQYIEPQYKLLKKFIKNDFKYIVFNNTLTNKIISQQDLENNKMLIDSCKKYKIQNFNIPKFIFNGIRDSNASLRAGLAINMSHKILFQNYSLNNTFFLIDTDAFLLNDFDVEEFMKDKKLSGRLQMRKGENELIKYITNHIVIFKPSSYNIKDFGKYFSFLPGRFDNVNCDCGFSIHLLLKQTKKEEFVNWKNNLFSTKGNNNQLFGGSPSEYDEFNHEFLNNLELNIKDFINKDTISLDKKYPFCEIFTNNNNNVIFLHLRAGTNWIGFDFSKRNTLVIY